MSTQESPPRACWHLIAALALVGLVGCSSSASPDDDTHVGPAPDAALDGPVTHTDGPTPHAEKPFIPPPPPKDGAPHTKDGSPPEKDIYIPPPPDMGVLPPDTGPPPTAYKVAAVQYAADQAALVSPSCAQQPMPDVCALKTLVAQARAQGATYVVIPEYSTGQEYYEPTPAIDDNPGTNPAWPNDTVIKSFSAQARQLVIYLAINLLTYEGTNPNYKYYNTEVAFGPTGKVIGTHKKFNLFGNEKNSLTAGTTVSVFNTSLGKVGILVCADIYGSTTLTDKLAYTLDARVVFVSSYWTVAGATTWFKTYLKKFPYAIVANTTDDPGIGGGIYAAGVPVAEKISNQPSVVIATIPAP